MAKRTLTTAVAFVDKRWFDEVFRFVLETRRSGSTGDVHVLQGDLKTRKIPTGCGFGTCPKSCKRAGSRFTVNMEVMVPWQYVLALTLFDEHYSVPFGFEGTEVTVLEPAAPRSRGRPAGA